MTCCLLFLSVAVWLHSDRWHGPLVTIDSTLLPCCVPQQFDLACLQDDIAKSFIVGKRLLQMPEGIHVMFQFKEQSRGQPITGNL